MKKIFFSLVALAAIAACSKSEIQYDDQQVEIGLSPVVQKSTKAAEDDNIYNTNIPMYIFANTYVDETPTQFTQPYFANALFTHRADGIFAGANSHYYWPNVKTLVFSGLSKSGNVNEENGATPQYTNANTIQLNGYAPGVGDAQEGDNDLMWFPTTSPYGKRNTAIEVEMKHACAWVTLNFKGDDVTGVGSNAWRILDINFKDLSQSGNVTLGENAIWGEIATGTDFSVYKYTGTNWEDAPSLTYKDEENTNYVYVDYTRKDFTDLVVIPQTPKSIFVTYKYESDTVNHIPFTETKEIPLTLGGANNWVPGYHYTYNITITTSEILVNPEVESWETANLSDITF